MESFKQVA